MKSCLWLIGAASLVALTLGVGRSSPLSHDAPHADLGYVPAGRSQTDPAASQDADHSAQASEPLNSAQPAATSAAATPSDGKIPPVREIFDRMVASIQSTPVLHLTVLDLHNGVMYEAQGWMTATKALCEVRRDDKVVFARFRDKGRIQEYSPSAKFVNGTVANHVLLEYDADPAGPSGDWPRLKDMAFGCGPGFIAADRYLGDQHPSMPEALLVNMEQATLTETTFSGKPCYWFHLEGGPDADKLTWNLYLDKVTCEPVQQSRVVLSKGKVSKQDTYDYVFEHLPNDNGITWGLDVSKLRR